MNATEIFGVILGIISGVFGIRQSNWHWPLSLALHLVFAVVFFEARLLGEASIQVIYFGLAIYGWKLWLAGSGGEVRPVTRMSVAEWLVFAAFVSGGSLLFGQVLVWVGGALPRLDAFVAVLFLAARVLFCLKRLEYWPVCILGDCVMIPMLLSRGLYPTAGLWIVYFGMAITGYWLWSKSHSHFILKRAHSGGRAPVCV